MQSAPLITLANSTAITLSWVYPKNRNGILTSFEVIRRKEELVAVSSYLF